MSLRKILLLAALVGLPLGGTVLAAEPVETVCLQCHSGQPGPLGAPVKDWPGSVHQRNGISCHDCHGGDPADYANAMSPERGFLGAPEHAAVPEFCGRCHVGVLGDYRESLHGIKVAQGGAQCVTCHGNHAVKEASLELINERDCTRCHDYARAAQIRTALAETDGRFAGLGEEFERLKLLGVNTGPAKGALFDLRNRYHRVFHSFNVEKVRGETTRIGGELDKLRAEVAGHDERFSRRKLWGGVAIGLLLALGVVLLQVRHSYEEEERDQ
jgi:nitrate/TMAO reductase-like tetraheme cytochrome c subunit